MEKDRREIKQEILVGLHEKLRQAMTKGDIEQVNMLRRLEIEDDWDEED